MEVFELITDETGHICQNEKELVEFLNSPSSFSPNKIIEYARGKFSSIDMAKKIMSLFMIRF